MGRRLHIATLTILALAAAAPWSSSRAQDYPAKTVTTVIPFAAGGAGDILSRILSRHWSSGSASRSWSRTSRAAVVSSGVLATTKSKPDGIHAADVAERTMAVNPALMKNLPYEPVADLMPLALVAGTPFMLVVNPALPVQSLADLVKYAKEKGGQLPFAWWDPARRITCSRKCSRA